MKKINEIFYSLQGEGFHVGTPAVFVRFSGCNFKCEISLLIYSKAFREKASMCFHLPSLSVFRDVI